MLLGLLLVVLSIWAAFRFFGRRRVAPRVVTALVIAGIATGLLVRLLEERLLGRQLTTSSGKVLYWSLVTGALWILYFNVSQRVKATFVR